MSARTNGGAPAPSGFTLLAFPGTVNTDRHEAQAHGLLTIPTSPALSGCIVRHARIIAELRATLAETAHHETAPITHGQEYLSQWQADSGGTDLHTRQRLLYRRQDDALGDIVKCTCRTLRDVRAQAAYLYVHLFWRSEEVLGSYTLPILEALVDVDDDATVYEAMPTTERRARREALDELVNRRVGDPVDLETQSRWLDMAAFKAWARAIDGADMQVGDAQ